MINDLCLSKGNSTCGCSPFEGKYEDSSTDIYFDIAMDVLINRLESQLVFDSGPPG